MVEKKAVKKKVVKKKAVKKTVKKAPVVAKQKTKEAFILPVVLDIAFASKLVDQLGDYISRVPKNFVVDGSKVSRLTTPCVQVLLCAHAKLVQEKSSLYLKSPSDVMVNVFKDLGLLDELNKWSISHE